MEGPAKQRVDKWLYHARFYKTRTLAAAQVSAGHVRVNGEKLSKPSTTIKTGDVLTFAQGNRIRVVEIVGLGQRRGPAPEAQMLYIDKTPETPKEQRSKNPKFEGKGRPTKRDRRKHDLSNKAMLE